MLTLEERLAVVNLFEELGSYRAVADLVGCDHKTVKAWLERDREGRAGPVRRAALIDAFTGLIRAKVDDTQGRIKSKPLLKILRAAGYRGSLRTLQRALRDARKQWARSRQRVYRPWMSAPGDFAIVDFGEAGFVNTATGKRRLYFFTAVLGWSRYRYVRFFTCQRFRVLAEGLAGFFETIGGVPANVLFDNPKTVTTGFVAGAAVLNVNLVRLATHYRFNPVTAAPADPETKGKVESVVRLVNGRIPPGGFAAPEQANVWAEELAAEVNSEVHSETQAVPNERLEAERPLFRSLPERPEAAGGDRRRVDRMSTIRFGSARYSVPWHLIGEDVLVAVDGNELRVMHGGGEVALHQLQPPGGVSVSDQHYPTPAPTGVRPLRARNQAERDFLALGDVADRWLRAAAAQGTPRLQQQLERALDLVRIHGADPVRAALDRAERFNRFAWDDLRSILATQGVSQPESLPPVVQLDVSELPSVPGRALESYRWPS